MNFLFCYITALWPALLRNCFELLPLVLFQRMGISQAYLEKWDQKVKRVKEELLLFMRVHLGFLVRTAPQDFVVPLVPLEPLVSAKSEVVRTQRSI